MIVREHHERIAPGERPREQMARFGPQVLRDHELLSLLLGSGVRGRSVDHVARQVLALIDTQVTEEGVKKFREALPNCKIEH